MRDLAEKWPKTKAIKEFHATFCKAISASSADATIKETNIGPNAEYSISVVSSDDPEIVHIALNTEYVDSLDFVEPVPQNTFICDDEIKNLHLDSFIKLLPVNLSQSANNIMYESSEYPTGAFLITLSNDSGIRTVDKSM